jgi:hypothetical protein
MRFKSEELTIRFDLSSFNRDLADLGEKLAAVSEAMGVSAAGAALSLGAALNGVSPMSDEARRVRTEMREALTPARLPLRAIRLRA